jgi:Domain of unknown function (DUF4279)
MDDYRFSVSLRIRHPSIDPETITRELGLIPEHSWRAGDGRPGEPASRAYRESYWLGRLRSVPYSEAWGPDALVATLEIQSLLLKRRKKLWERIRDGGQADFLVSICGRDLPSIDLTPKTIAFLDGIGLSISFEAEGVAVAA